MTKYAPLWQQAGSYSASLDRSLVGALWPAGGCSGAAVTTVANTMNVQAAVGSVAVALQSGQGSALCRWDNPAADSTVALAAAPASGQSRNDLVIVQVRDNALDSGGNNDFIVTSVTGTPATTGSQVTPALPTNAYALAVVTVPGAAADLNTATVADRRYGLMAASPGRVLASAIVASPSYSYSGGSYACIDAANAVLGVVAPPSGRVLMEASSVFNNSTTGVKALMAWTNGTVNNTGFVGAATHTGTIDGGAYKAVRWLLPVTPLTPYTLALQWVPYNVAGSITINSDPLVLTATELP